MRDIRVRIRTVVASFVVMLVAASSAQAHTTVCHINPEDGTGHCYALAVWHPEDGWFAEGAELKIDTITDYLPGAAEGDYFTNETWVGFHHEQWWTETGQSGDETEGMRYFWGREDGHGFEGNYPWYPEYASLNYWAQFKQQNEPGKCSGCWGVWINNTGVQVNEEEDHSWDLESGLEMTDTNISNTFESTEPYWEDDGTWHASWVASG